MPRKSKIERGFYPISLTHIKQLIKNCENWGYGNKETCKYVTETTIEWLQMKYESLPIVETLETDLICIVHNMYNGARYKSLNFSFLT